MYHWPFWRGFGSGLNRGASLRGGLGGGGSGTAGRGDFFGLWTVFLKCSVDGDKRSFTFGAAHRRNETCLQRHPIKIKTNVQKFKQNLNSMYDLLNLNQVHSQIKNENSSKVYVLIKTQQKSENFKRNWAYITVVTYAGVLLVSLEPEIFRNTSHVFTVLLTCTLYLQY